MKKLLFIFLLLCPLGISAQNQFSCLKFEEDLKKWESLHQEESFDTKAWSVRVYKEFPLNSDGAIEYTYILTAKETYDQKSIRELITKWFDISFTRAANVVEYADDNVVKGHGVFQNIVSYTGFSSVTYICAPVDINIYIKDNRIKFQEVVQHYSMGAYDSFAGSESRLSNIADCYPANRKGDHKESYARAIINTGSKCLNEMSSFLSFMNKHINDAKADKQNDW